MLDPLSVGAGVVGIIIAVVQISNLLKDFIRRTSDAPDQANAILTEIGHIHMIMEQLRPFLHGIENVDESRTSLVQIESVLVILTACVSTFSGTTRAA